MEVVTASEVVENIASHSMIVPGGFGCCGHPDLFTEALVDRYNRTGKPHSIRLLFASGAGDKNGKGIDKLAVKGMVKEAIGGFWGFCPRLTEAALAGDIVGHNWPMGVVSHLFREIASGSPGLHSKVGLGSFVDPDLEGGTLLERSLSLVSKAFLNHSEYLFYPSQKVDFALLRGSYSDAKGNISMIHEIAYHDALMQAMATKKYGGKVAVQVKGIVPYIPPHEVSIPAIMVDYVSVCPREEDHLPSYGIQGGEEGGAEALSVAKRIIVSRALQEMPQDKSCVNLGIGIPALIGARLNSAHDQVFVTVESGVFGGNPLYGLSFGASDHPDAIINQGDLFTFYDGGGIDVTFLGFAEIDSFGRVNASKFGGKLTGAGGFINIAQSAKKIVLCGTLTTGGLELAQQGGELRLVREGRTCKFVAAVQQVTIDTNHSVFDSKEIIIITDRAVFQLTSRGLMLCEIAPGISPSELERLVDVRFYISSSIKTMVIE